MAKKLTKAEQIAKKDYIEFARIPGDEKGISELRGYLKTLKSGYNRRVQSFKRQGLYSYAQDSLENSLSKEFRSVQLTKLTRRQLLAQISAYSKFFNDETSSVSGIRKVNREQDARIFGAYKNGRPKNSMSEEQRKEFWRLYDEFRNQFPKWSTQPYSETTQQYIAFAMFQQEDFSQLDFTNRLEVLNLLLTEELETYSPEEMPDVYTGAGPDFSQGVAFQAIQKNRKRG